MRVLLMLSVITWGLGMLACSRGNEVPDNPSPGTSDTSKPFSTINGGSLGDVYQCGTPASDGGYIMAGCTQSTDGDFGSGGAPHDALIVKYNAMGKLLWFKKYIGNDDDQLYHILSTADGGYLLTGQSNSTDGNFSGNKGKMDIWVMKIDAQGNKLWSKTYGGTNNDLGYHALITADGGYLITGVSYSNDGDAAGNHQVNKVDGLVIRINGTGAVQWRKMLGGSEHEYLYQAVATADGGFLLAGNTQSRDGDIVTNHGSMDGWLVKLSADGELLSSHTYGDVQSEGFRSIVKTADNGVVLAGYIRSTNGPGAGNKGAADGWLLKVNAAGNIVWSKLFGDQKEEGFSTVITTPEGHFMATGMQEAANNKEDALLVSADLTGNHRWTRKLGGNDQDWGFHLFYAPREQKYVMGGATRSNDGNMSSNRGDADAWIYCFE